MSTKKPLLVALRDEREKTISVLGDAFAADLFDVDEYESRVARAEDATTCEALVVLRQDLVVAEDESDAPNTALVQQRKSEQEALIRAQPDAKWAVAIMGSVERKGPWRVPKKLRVTAVMGGAKLDFREALLAPGVSELKILACMGSVDIIVPPEVEIEWDGVGIMGSFESGELSNHGSEPGRPILRIAGLAVMGSVNLKVRLPGESSWQARKRRKRERKELASSNRKQLANRNK